MNRPEIGSYIRFRMYICPVASRCWVASDPYQLGNPESAQLRAMLAGWDSAQLIRRHALTLPFFERSTHTMVGALLDHRRAASPLARAKRRAR